MSPAWLAALLLASPASAPDPSRSEGWVVLPVNDYRDLRARAYPPSPPPEPLAFAALLTRVEYDLKVAGETATGRARLHVDVLREGWVRVPAPAGLLVREARLDGRPVPLLDGDPKQPAPEALLSRTGRAVLELDVVIPVASAAGTESITVPQSTAAVTQVTLTLPRQGVDLQVPGGLLLESATGRRQPLRRARPIGIGVDAVVAAQGGRPASERPAAPALDRHPAGRPGRGVRAGDGAGRAGGRAGAGRSRAGRRCPKGSPSTRSRARWWPTGRPPETRWPCASWSRCAAGPASWWPARRDARARDASRRRSCAWPAPSARRAASRWRCWARARSAARTRAAWTPADPEDLGPMWPAATRLHWSRSASGRRTRRRPAGSRWTWSRYTPEAILVANVDEAHYRALLSEDGKALVQARYAVRNNQRASWPSRCRRAPCCGARASPAGRCARASARTARCCCPCGRARRARMRPRSRSRWPSSRAPAPGPRAGRHQLLLPALDLPVSRTGHGAAPLAAVPCRPARGRVPRGAGRSAPLRAADLSRGHRDRSRRPGRGAPAGGRPRRRRGRRGGGAEAAHRPFPAGPVPPRRGRDARRGPVPRSRPGLVPRRRAHRRKAPPPRVELSYKRESK